MDELKIGSTVRLTSGDHAGTIATIQGIKDDGETYSIMSTDFRLAADVPADSVEEYKPNEPMRPAAEPAMTPDEVKEKRAAQREERLATLHETRGEESGEETAQEESADEEGSVTESDEESAEEETSTTRRKGRKRH